MLTRCRGAGAPYIRRRNTPLEKMASDEVMGRSAEWLEDGRSPAFSGNMGPDT